MKLKLYVIIVNLTSPEPSYFAITLIFFTQFQKIVYWIPGILLRLVMDLKNLNLYHSATA